MALLAALFLALLTQGPEYPLGRLRLPPIAEDASPFRLVDLRYSFTEADRTVSSFETRVRAGGRMFVGGEVTGDRRGLFLDTQRLELGVSEENGSYEIEGSLRAPRFLLSTGAFRDDEDDWAFGAAGSVRLSNDLEVLLRHSQDLDETRFVPGTVEEFADTGVLPPLGPPTRELRGTSLGMLYQRENHLELLADARVARVRTEAGFEQSIDSYRVAGLWNPARAQIEGEVSYSSTSGRLGRNELGAALDLTIEVLPHWLARASTLQRWEPGVLRFEEDYRIGATFLGRRHRFPRRSEAAPSILELQRRANALGYNERRVYDVDSLRRFRERLGISPARRELADLLDELYLLEVRDRNVPQLGFELGLGERPIQGIESRTYRTFLAMPWPIGWPFERNEHSVEFLRVDFGIIEERFPAGVRAVTRQVGVTASLNRELSIAFRWERPGVVPREVIEERGRPRRFTVSFDYSMGR